MDSLITAAARALAVGDPIGALKRVALRDDAAALALRGIAMAQLGELERARVLLRSARRAFHPRETVARARCALAEAEIALVSRDLAGTDALAAAAVTLAAHGDRLNAAYAQTLEVRRLLLIGRLDAAERALEAIEPSPLPPPARAAYEIAAAGIAMRRVRAGPAGTALARAADAARAAGIPGLVAEVEASAQALAAPAARRLAAGNEALLDLAGVEALLESGTLVVDACRGVVRAHGTVVSLATRPVLFALARTLAEAFPADAARETLLARAFGARHADESHRVRLRVEIGRLRRELDGLADICATAGGFVLVPDGDAGVVVLAPPVDEPHAPLLAVLADGEAWSSSALALALGTSARTVQRALDALAAADKVRPVGRGRSRRWTTPPMPGFPTSLLLPGPPPGG